MTFKGRNGYVVPEDGDYAADMVEYDNTASGLEADDVQAAIDELADSATRLVPKNEITEMVDLDDLTDVDEYSKIKTNFFVTNAPLGIDSNMRAKFKIKVEKLFEGENDLQQTLVTDTNIVYRRYYKSSLWSEWQTSSQDLIYKGTKEEWEEKTVFEKTIYSYALFTND